MGSVQGSRCASSGLTNQHLLAGLTAKNSQNPAFIARLGELASGYDPNAEGLFAEIWAIIKTTQVDICEMDELQLWSQRGLGAWVDGDKGLVCSRQTVM